MSPINSPQVEESSLPHPCEVPGRACDVVCKVWVHLQEKNEKEIKSFFNTVAWMRLMNELLPITEEVHS